MFTINKWRRVTDIIDGTSMTLAVGESFHATKWGLGPGYGIGTQGGPVGWLWGAACTKPTCPVSNQSYDRDMRNTTYAINTVIPNIADDQQTDLPFGSFHSGGSQFLFADGHVRFLSESTAVQVLHDMASINGSEVADSSSY
jgi:prepilin-type processing-associated H-X9-DG protein